MTEEYMERPIDIKLEIPYSMPIKLFNELERRVRLGKKFVVTLIESGYEKKDRIVCNIKIELEW